MNLEDIGVNTAVKLKGIRQWVKPIAIGTHLATRTEWVEVWDSSHGFTWSNRQHYRTSDLLWSRKRRAS